MEAIEEEKSSQVITYVQPSREESARLAKSSTKNSPKKHTRTYTQNIKRRFNAPYLHTEQATTPHQSNFNIVDIIIANTQAID